MKNAMKSITEWTRWFGEEKPTWSVRVLRWFDMKTYKEEKDRSKRKRSRGDFMLALVENGKERE